MMICRRPSIPHLPPNLSGRRALLLRVPGRRPPPVALLGSPVLAVRRIRRRPAGLYPPRRRRGGLLRPHPQVTRLLDTLPSLRPTAGQIHLCGEELRPRAMWFLAMFHLQRRLGTRRCARKAKPGRVTDELADG